MKDPVFARHWDKLSDVSVFGQASDPEVERETEGVSGGC